MSSDYTHILNVKCRDQIGLVATVSGYLADRNCNILRSSQFEDAESDTFFMRICFDAGSESSDEELATTFQPIADQLEMEWSLTRSDHRPCVLILVSKFSHCLVSLLQRHYSGRLEIEIVAIVSNHPDLKAMADFYGIPYHYWPCTIETKPAQEAKILELIQTEGVELVVLARYMQILSDEFCSKTFGKVINIHHSFLPSFKGAKPYHQAHQRGVKVIGATAHYVTTDLGEGPIIDQEVYRVGHEQTAHDLVRLGEDVEAFTLGRAVAAHVEKRVMLNGSRTVEVFNTSNREN